jgi:hypothetical protein
MYHRINRQAGDLVTLTPEDFENLLWVLKAYPSFMYFVNYSLGNGEYEFWHRWVYVGRVLLAQVC